MNLNANDITKGRGLSITISEDVIRKVLDEAYLRRYEYEDGLLSKRMKELNDDADKIKTTFYHQEGQNFYLKDKDEIKMKDVYEMLNQLTPFLQLE